jgi:hypothetical protein
MLPNLRPAAAAIYTPSRATRASTIVARQVYLIHGVASVDLGHGNREGTRATIRKAGTPKLAGHGWVDISDTDQIKNLKTWGFNTYCMAIEWGNLEPTAPELDPHTGGWVHCWNAEHVAAIHNVVQECHKQGLNVIVLFYQTHTTDVFHIGRMVSSLLGGNWRGFPHHLSSFVSESRAT